MKITSLTAMLDRIETCDDPARLAHYVDPANVTAWRSIGGGSNEWSISVNGYAGGVFSVTDRNPRGMQRCDANGWAAEIRRRASAKLELIEAGELVAC